MRNLLLICFFLLSCEVIYEPPKPIYAYYSEITVNSASGKVISSEVTSDFLFEQEAINKCWEKSLKGVTYQKDSISNITTIKVTTWIYTNSKNK